MKQSDSYKVIRRVSPQSGHLNPSEKVMTKTNAFKSSILLQENPSICHFGTESKLTSNQK